MSKDSHSFSVSVAQQVGVPGAIIMQHFLFLQKANISGAENWQEKWVKRSAKSIAKTYPYWSGKQVASITDSLEKGEYLFSKIENASKIDRTKSFILTPKGLLLMGEIPFAQMENGFSKLGNANAQMENAIPENGKCNIEEDYTSFIPSFIEENAGASDPLSPPYKKVADIYHKTFSVEAQQPEPTSPGRGAIRVSITGPEHPDVPVLDVIEPKTDAPKTSRGKSKSARTNEPTIHPENETVFAHFTDPDKARAAWAEWIKYKYEQHRERYKSAASELIKLRSLFKETNGSSDSAATMIEHSIGNLYRGIYAPKSEKNGQPNGLNAATRQHLNLAKDTYERWQRAFAGDAPAVDYITGAK